MKVKVKETGKTIEVYPKGNGKELRFVHFDTKEDYSWDELEPVRLVSDKKKEKTAVAVKVGVSMDTKIVEQTQYNQKVKVN